MKWVRLIAEMGLGMLFLYSGGVKIIASGVAVFAADVEKYHLLPAELVPWMAYGLPWLEIVVGICLLGQFFRRGALAASLGMTLMFLGAIAWAWRQGLDISCGCFGKSDATIHYPRKMAELLLQLAAILVAMWSFRRLRDEIMTESSEESS
ncbi:MAG: DoxX family membrane protein [Verrucomicrobia bacterium]|nr:MAG: DoxX family membrane protein [Verrucomicrobiota bacterium]